jgi:hypothetical protein
MKYYYDNDNHICYAISFDGETIKYKRIFEYADYEIYCVYDIEDVLCAIIDDFVDYCDHVTHSYACENSICINGIKDKKMVNVHVKGGKISYFINSKKTMHVTFIEYCGFK